MKKFSRLRSMCVAILAVFGCFLAVQSIASELDKTTWVFEANSLGDEWVEAVGSDPLTLEFRDGDFTGYAGCNTFFGTYRRDGNKLSIGPVGSTKMLCEGDRQHQEDVLLEAFERILAFEIDDDFLHLDTGNGTSLVYRRMGKEGNIIDRGGLHTYATCLYAGGQVDQAQGQCRIDGRIYQKNK